MSTLCMVVTHIDKTTQNYCLHRTVTLGLVTFIKIARSQWYQKDETGGYISFTNWQYSINMKLGTIVIHIYEPNLLLYVTSMIFNGNKTNYLPWQNP